MIYLRKEKIRIGKTNIFPLMYHFLKFNTLTQVISLTKRFRKTKRNEIFSSLNAIKLGIFAKFNV